MTNEAYSALIDVLDMAETEDMFNAFQNGDEGTYEKIFNAVSKVGGKYMLLPETETPRYELQRRLGIGISVGLLDATQSNPNSLHINLEGMRPFIDGDMKNAKNLNEVSKLATQIGGNCDKDYIKGTMDLVRETYPAHK